MRQIRHIALLGVCIVIYIGSSSPVMGQEVTRYQPKVNRILFLLDGSGSMNEKWGSRTRFEAAKDILFHLVDSIEHKNKHVEFAIRIFGFQQPRERHDCKDSRLVVAFAKNNAPNFRKSLLAIKPQGMTPIAYSIEEGAKDFPIDSHALNAIILISDGEENCSGDPCRLAKEFVKRRVSLKPFIIGLNVDVRNQQKFECIGTFMNADKEMALQQAVGVVVKQTLNPTTVQINLLDRQDKPSITNLPFTLYDHHTGVVMYNFIHALDARGYPDTLYLDPKGIYDIEVHTIPSVRKEGIELTVGTHNIIALSVPVGELSTVCKATYNESDAQIVLREHGKTAILLVQDPNENDKLLTRLYSTEALTTPEVMSDSVFVPADKHAERILAQPGILNLVAPSALYIVDVLHDDKNNHSWVTRYDMRDKNESGRLQPGKYLLVYKVKQSYQTEDTRTQPIIIEPARTLTITLP
jgi:Ca-activated chloride channel homolog